MSVTVEQVWEALTPEEREGLRLVDRFIISDVPGGTIIAHGTAHGIFSRGHMSREIKTAKVFVESAIWAERARQKRREIVAALDPFGDDALSDEDDGVRLVLPIRDVEHARAVVRALRGVEVDGG